MVVEPPSRHQHGRRARGLAAILDQPSSGDAIGQMLASVVGSSAGANRLVMTEAELAAMRMVEGEQVVLHEGRYWRSTHPGFYEPVHLLGRMRHHEASRPTPLCWGYRTALASGDAGRANRVMPVYLLDIDRFSQHALSRNRKADLRKCGRKVDFRIVQEPSLLLEQGHDVFMSSVDRLGCWDSLTEAEYQRRVERRCAHGRRQIVAGMVDGRLAGYLDAFAVDGVLYLEEIYVSTDALSTGIVTGLYVVAIETALDPGGIREVCNGLHTPELPGLCHFKESLRFRVARLPVRSVIPSPILTYIRVRRPAQYYHLTGEMPGVPGMPGP